MGEEVWERETLVSSKRPRQTGSRSEKTKSREKQRGGQRGYQCCCGGLRSCGNINDLDDGVLGWRLQDREYVANGEQKSNGERNGKDA